MLLFFYCSLNVAILIVIIVFTVLFALVCIVFLLFWPHGCCIDVDGDEKNSLGRDRERGRGRQWMVHVGATLRCLKDR